MTIAWPSDPARTRPSWPAAWRKVRAARRLLPADVAVSVTRDYGETAGEKSNELIEHLLIASVSVSVLSASPSGSAPALVVRSPFP